MKRMKRKSLLLVAGIALMLMVAIGGTIAYIVTDTKPITNTFEPGRVPITITENFKNGTKSDVRVKNTGNVPAYIRAKIVVTWKDADGNVSAIKPVEGTDYTISINGTEWTKAGDGFYYHIARVGAGESTNPLITSCTKVAGANQPAGYDLSVEIIAESIQAEGMGATGAQDAFHKANSNS